MMINGQHSDVVASQDRGLAYGDGAFETALIINGRPVLWREHLDRLAAACDVLGIPLDDRLLAEEVDRLLAGQNLCRAVLKVMVTRGVGGRGYMPPSQPTPTRIIQIHPFPKPYDHNAREGVQICLCRHPVSRNRALAGIKHLNRLDQVLASMELGDGIAEGLMFDDDGRLVEGTRSNVFLVRGAELLTPDLSQAGVAGIMRDWIMRHCHQQGLPLAVTQLARGDIEAADEVFVCNSVFGIWPVRKLIVDDHFLEWSTGVITRQLQSASLGLFSPGETTSGESKA